MDGWMDAGNDVKRMKEEVSFIASSKRAGGSKALGVGERY